MATKLDATQGEDDGILTPSTPSEDMATHLQWAYTTRTHSDCKLIVGPDRVVIEAHKIIIVISPFFRGALEPGRFKEGFENCVELPEDDPENVERVLSYLYTGTYTPEACDWKSIPGTDWMARMDMELNFIHLRVYILANKLLLSGLQEIAYNRIKSTLPAQPNTIWYWSLKSRKSPISLVDEVYRNTTSSAIDLRNLMTEWIINTLCQELAPDADDKDRLVIMSHLVAIPEFGPAFAGILFDGYQENRKRVGHSV